MPDDAKLRAMQQAMAQVQRQAYLLRSARRGATPQEPGARGEPGPPGPPGQAYVHRQDEAAEVWIVNHNFGWMPSVAVIDSAARVVEGHIVHHSLNQVRIYFDEPVRGSARCT